MFEAHFQTFEEPEGGVALTARLGRFREELARRKLTGFVIPRADQQQNEYVAPSEERLAWLTGFTGSAGMAIVLTKEAAVFVDAKDFPKPPLFLNDLEVDFQGNLYVSDSGDHKGKQGRVFRVSPQGKAPTALS